jgi:hypothetical protein
MSKEKEMLIEIVAPIHRYLGETMLLVAIIGVVLAIVGLVRKQVLEKPENVFAMVYSGLLDLQVVLGFLFFFLLPGPGRPTILHPILMTLAAVMVHAGRAWRGSPSPTRHWAQLGIYGASLMLIFAGRMLLV